jgi:hypothetical protein
MKRGLKDYVIGVMKSLSQGTSVKLKSCIPCAIDDEDDIEENDNKKEEFNLEAMIPHISLNALEGTTGFYTLKVTWRVDKHFYSL